MIHVKRVYDLAEADDGARFLIDQLWPRGLKKNEVKIRDWLKAVAPSQRFRKWFNHDPARWQEFQRRYAAELDQRPEAWRPLLAAQESEADVTLLYSARNTAHNHAVALKSYLERQAHRSTANQEHRSSLVASHQ